MEMQRNTKLADTALTWYLKVVPTLLLMMYAWTSFSQQEAQYTQYMYNTSMINPAYSGSEEVFKVSLLHRSQWVGIDGAPTTQTLNIEGVLGRRLGASLNVSKDAIGPSEEIIIDANVAYHIQLTRWGRLSVGLKGGARRFNIDLNKGNLNAGQTPDNVNNVNNEFFPTLGAGIYFYTSKTYLGFSVPNFLESNYFDRSTNDKYRDQMHFHFIAGTVFDIGKKLKFKPAVLAKATAGAPIALDVSGNFMINERFILGIAYRMDAAISGLVGFNISQNLFLGYAYDYNTSILNQYTGGSHELFLSIKLPRIKVYKSPRFF